MVWEHLIGYANLHSHNLSSWEKSDYLPFSDFPNRKWALSPTNFVIHLDRSGV